MTLICQTVHLGKGKEIIRASPLLPCVALVQLQ